jgi:hypothetical protein
MKKMFFLMLLVAGAASMKGQEIPNSLKMVVTGNMVNTGAMTATIPIDLRTNATGVGQIDNIADGDIKTPALNVGAETLLNNEGDICVGCGASVYTPIIVRDAAKDYPGGVKGDVAKDWISPVVVGRKNRHKTGFYLKKAYGAGKFKRFKSPPDCTTAMAMISSCSSISILRLAVL